MEETSEKIAVSFEVGRRWFISPSFHTKPMSWFEMKQKSAIKECGSGIERGRLIVFPSQSYQYLLGVFRLVKSLPQLVP